MDELISEEERSNIRNRLEAHMSAFKLSPKKIERIMKAHREELGSPVSADTIRRFLDPSEDSTVVTSNNVGLIRNYMDLAPKFSKAPFSRKAGSRASMQGERPRIFQAFQSFFGMRPEKANGLRERVVGKWQFYAYSEGSDDHVCRGAIQFESSTEDEFTAHEVQESIKSGVKIREHHEGYFLFRKNAMIVNLRSHIESAPKYYVLSIDPYPNDDGQYVVMTGALLKVGVHTNVEFGKIHMERDKDAFDRCDVLPATHSEIRRILPHLDNISGAVKLLGGRPTA